MAIWDIKQRYNIVMNNEIRGDRCIFAGGAAPTVNTMEFVNLSTTGDAADFGDLTLARYVGMHGNATRGLAMGGGSPTSNVIDYVTTNSLGNAADFGDLTLARFATGGVGNETRQICAGGGTPTRQNVMDFVTMASTGDAADFGDLTAAKSDLTLGIQSPTRGIFAGGVAPSYLNVIEYITIASTGDGTDFGDLDTPKGSCGGASTTTKGVIVGGLNPSSGNHSELMAVTIASEGNAIDFGDIANDNYGGGCGTNTVKAVYGGGYVSCAVVDNIESFSMVTLSSVSDFGDLSVARGGLFGANTGGHGGLEANTQRPSVTYMPGSGRALFGGGIQPASSNVIDFITTSTLGNAVDFGNLRFNRYYHTAFASSTRFFSMAGVDGTGSTANTDDVEYINFASQGNCSFFSDGTVTNRQMVGFSNATRGVSGGASSPYINVIEYIVLASVGTNGADFGNLSANRSYMGGFASPTRGVFVGGFAPGAQVNDIQYITIASTGDTTDFGDLTQTARNCAGMASSVRGLRFSGESGGSFTNVIDYVTIASTGDASDFGDVTVARQDASTAASSTRGIGAGGQAPGYSNVMDYVTIASTGDAADFGDLTLSASHHEGSSDSHGGLHG